MRRLLITGAAGTIGTMLRDGMRGLATQTRLLDLHRVDAGTNEEVVIGDVADLAVARRAIEGCSARPSGACITTSSGLRVACIRIGSALPRPLDERHLSTWISPGDLNRLVKACLTSPDLGFAIVYGASANRRGWWDLEPGRRLGYEPQDDSEVYAADIEPVPPHEFQGGDKFTGPDSTP